MLKNRNYNYSPFSLLQGPCGIPTWELAIRDLLCPKTSPSNGTTSLDEQETVWFTGVFHLTSLMIIQHLVEILEHMWKGWDSVTISLSSFSLMCTRFWPLNWVPNDHIWIRVGHAPIFADAHRCACSASLMWSFWDASYLSGIYGSQVINV